MSSVHLKEFAKERGQPEAAMLLGLTQGALSKAIRVGRNVVVTHEADGSFTAEERRPFPARPEGKTKTFNRSTLNANVRDALSSGQSDESAVQTSSAGSA